MVLQLSGNAESASPRFRANFARHPYLLAGGVWERDYSDTYCSDQITVLVVNTRMWIDGECLYVEVMMEKKVGI